MSSANIHSNDRPAVLGGPGIVPVRRGATLKWHQSRWAVEPVVTPAPTERDPDWPYAPIFSPVSIDKAHRLLGAASEGAASLGYLGRYERELEQRVADEIGPDDQGRTPKVFAVASGSLGLEIGYAAVMTIRSTVESRRMPTVPNAPTTVRSFEATWTQLLRSGIRARFADVDPDTGCVTVDALRRMIDEDSVLLAPAALYDGSVDVPAVGALAKHADRRFVFDCAHGHKVTWNGVHVSKDADITIVSGQGSKITTPGWEGGLIIVFDPMLAAIIAKMRNVGRDPSPLPDWWPADVPDVAGYNGRLSELAAVLWMGSMDMYDQLEERRTRNQRLIRAELPNLGGPWRTLPGQPELGGLGYKQTFLFSPEWADNPRAWQRIGFHAAGRAGSAALLTEFARSYPGPWEKASEYHPTSRPWQWTPFVPEIEPERYPVARMFAGTAHMLPHQFLAREHGAEQFLEMVVQQNRWVEDREFVDWAERYTASIGS